MVAGRHDTSFAQSQARNLDQHINGRRYIQPSISDLQLVQDLEARMSSENIGKQQEARLFTNERAQAKEPQILLTKFAALPAEESYDANQQSHYLEQSRLAEVRSLSAGELLSLQQKENHSKWPWTLNKLDLSNPNISSACFDDERQPFQVIWRRLSFEVNPSTYDQLVRQAFGRLLRLWPSHRKSAGESDGGPEAISQEEWASSAVELAGKLPPSGERVGGQANRKRIIFEHLNGYVKSGEITAILGPSGAGKTTLLNGICGKTENYKGTVQLVGGGNRRMRLSIIPQKDYLMESLTVRENLLYASRILNTDDRQFDHEANIMRVVKMLNLTHCFHSKAANISGGEYKRVSIGQELLRQPDILILDEPTSGLDSMNCKNLIKSLVQLIGASRKGTMKPLAIVMTIHQPDVDIFQMFDHIYCMGRGGRVIFDGHPSEVADVIRANAGFLPGEMPSNIMPNGCQSGNMANLLIEIASEEVYGRQPVDRLANYQRRQFEQRLSSCFRDTQAMSDNFVVHPNQTESAGEVGPLKFGTNKLAINIKERSNNLSLPVDGTVQLQLPPSPGNLSIDSSWSSGSNSNKNRRSQLVRDKRLNAKIDHSGQFWRHTRLLASRAFTSTIRDPLMTIIALLFHLLVPFIMWTVYSQKIGTVKACPKLQRELDIISMVSNNTMGLMEEMQEDFNSALECCTMFFLSTYSFSVCSLSVAALAFPLNMHVLLKETRNGWYSLPSFVIGKTIANFPFEVLFPVASLVIIYLLLDMPGGLQDWRIWAIALVCGLISMISHTQGLIFGALCMDSVQTAIFLASSSTLPQTMLSGFTARIKHMPLLLQRLSWLSLYRYSSDSINIIRFGFGICPCDKTTDEYLRTKPAVFTDVPANMKPLFTYYLTNTAPQVSSDIDSSNSSVLNSNSSLIEDNSFKSIPGIDYEFNLNSTARAEMLRLLDSNELDLFGRMADMMTRSFTYGREVKDCTAVRSQLLTTAGAPEDDFLPYLFAGMIGLLIAAKIILFVIVKYKIGRRV